MNKTLKLLAIIIFQVVISLTANAQSSVWLSYYERGLESYQNGNLKESEKFLKLAVSEAERSLKSKEEKADEMLCDTLSSLSGVLGELEKYDEAENTARRALKIADIIYRESDSEYSRILNNLGLVLSQKEKFDEAEKIHRKAMKIREKYDSPPYRNLIISIVNLGKVYFDQGKYAESEALLDLAKGYFSRISPEQVQDGDFSLMITIFGNQAKTYEKLGKLDKAKSFYESIISLIEISRGEDHPSIIPFLENYGNVLRAKKMDKAAARVDKKLNLLKSKYK